MIPQQFPEHLKTEIGAEIAEASTQLADGMAADWPDYRQRIGFIKGLARVIDIIDNITEDKEKRR